MQDQSPNSISTGSATGQTAAFSRQTARNAAIAAAQNFEASQKKAKGKGPGMVALYTWGLLAIASVGWIGATGLIPQGEPNTTTMAQNEPERLTTPDIIAPAQEPKFALKQSISEQQSVLVIEQDAFENTDSMVTGSLPPIPPVEAPQRLKLGVSIGSGPDAKKLMQHYFALSRREPNLFKGVLPRITKADGSIAHLIAGPFPSSRELAGFCRSLRLRLTLSCAKADYTGKPFQTR